jgi:hypothetical protein
VAAVVVAAWRQIQRDNTLATDTGTESESVPPTAAPEPSSSLFTPSVSEDSTKAELYEVASEMKIEGRSKMNKRELLAAIRAAS